MAAPVDVTALADEIASLTKLYSNPSSTPPNSFEHRQAQQAIVNKAKNLINHVQNPFLAPMDHCSNVGILPSISSREENVEHCRLPLMLRYVNDWIMLRRMQSLRTEWAGKLSLCFLR
jgi:hypothetical protein